MKYGYFDDERREFVITDPRTPEKWINYIGTLEFGGFVDNSGGGVVCAGDPGLNRITRYIPQLPASDMNGETLYVRFRDGNGYRMFSPYYVPTCDEYSSWSCRVGLGYTRFTGVFYGLECDITVFVPVGGRVVLRDIRVTNRRDREVELDVVPVVEYSHFDALKQLSNADWVPQTMRSRAVRDGSFTILKQYAFMHRDTRVNFFTSNLPASSFETDRKIFLGANGFGSWRRPLSLERDELSNTQADRGDNIAALMHRLGTLAPGRTVRLVTQLGQAGSVEAAPADIAAYRDERNVDAAFETLSASWDEFLSVLTVKTPEPGMNSMLNIHNPRQCRVTKNWSRYLSRFQLGLGSRGIGFRDSSQDVMGVLSQIPGEAKALLEKLLSVQKADGSAMHQFYPLTMEASVGDSAEYEDRPHYYSDDHLWAVLAAVEYVKETGDVSFLGKEIPFYDRKADGTRVRTGTVLEHLAAGLEFTAGDLGSHGLPRLGFADWNDTVNLRAGAESVFTANLYGTALRELSGLLRFTGDEKSASRFGRLYDAMKETVNREAWDGEWYARYFDADGTRLGSKRNEKCSIYVNAQSWSVISGFADPERGRTALDSVNRLLNTKYGVKLSAPGYDGYDRNIGGITTYPPGAKENGGIFLHANPWVMIAETILGRGDRAYRYYEQINPATRLDDLDLYEMEPYCYAQNYLGDEHPQFGLARNSWLSGTASWTYQAATKYILGIRPDFDALVIDPCVPAGWEGFAAVRKWRGGTYRIFVENAGGTGRGVGELTVNGREVRGNRVPALSAGSECEVRVVLKGR